MIPPPKDRLAYLHADWEGKAWPHVPAPATVLETIYVVVRASSTTPWEDLLAALGLPEDPPARREAGFRVLAVVRALRVLRLLESEADPLELTDDGFEAIGLPRKHEIEERAAKKAAAWAATAAARTAEIRADRAAREGKYELICGCGHVEFADPKPEAIAELNARSCPRCGESWAPSPPSLETTVGTSPAGDDLEPIPTAVPPERLEEVLRLEVAVHDAVETATRAIGDLAALSANDEDESDPKRLRRSEHPIVKAQNELRQMRTACVNEAKANSAETAREVGGDLARLGADAESSSGVVQLSILGMGGPDGMALSRAHRGEPINRYPELPSFEPPTEPCGAICMSGPYAGVRCTLHPGHAFDQDDHEAWEAGEMLDSWARTACPECHQFFGCSCCETTGKHLLQALKSDYFTDGKVVCVRCGSSEAQTAEVSPTRNMED